VVKRRATFERAAGSESDDWEIAPDPGTEVAERYLGLGFSSTLIGEI
jgi:hypothetical protein